MSRPKKIAVKRKYEVKESGPQQDNNLGERLDLKHIPRLRANKSKAEQRNTLVVAVMICVIFGFTVVRGFDLALVEKDMGFAKYMVAVCAGMLYLVTRHYFESGKDNYGKVNRQRSLSSYFGLFERVARLYRRITRKGAD